MPACSYARYLAALDGAWNDGLGEQIAACVKNDSAHTTGRTQATVLTACFRCLPHEARRAVEAQETAPMSHSALRLVSLEGEAVSVIVVKLSSVRWFAAAVL
jgi:hypothetical protein